MPSTFTVCFCGTDCWPDESIKDRSASGGSKPEIYGPAGYIPVKIYNDLIATSRKALVPGPGKPYMKFKDRLWAPYTIPGLLDSTDMLLGLSMWDLAAHAAARVVGVPSLGRKAADLTDIGDAAVRTLYNAVQTQIGAVLGPNRKPPSHDRLQFGPELLELLLGSSHANQGVTGGPITTINLIGHSRGGVAAIMCSHELAALFPNAAINIFAIDPVPGAGWSLSTEMMTLPTQVKNYVGVYAVDEVSNGFNGVVPRVNFRGSLIDPLLPVADLAHQINVPNYHLIYAPGRHGTVAGNQTPDGTDVVSTDTQAASQVGLLVNYLARACLKRWGTSIEPLANQGSLASLKSSMTSYASSYRAMRSTTYTGSIGTERERGVTSSDSLDPSAWGYLEDAIGSAPLVDRGVTIRTRPTPGQVKWTRIQDIANLVFTRTDTAVDVDFAASPPP